MHFFALSGLEAFEADCKEAEERVASVLPCMNEVVVIPVGVRQSDNGLCGVSVLPSSDVRDMRASL